MLITASLNLIILFTIMHIICYLYLSSDSQLRVYMGDGIENNADFVFSFPISYM